jgi:mandelate racemase
VRASIAFVPLTVEKLSVRPLDLNLARPVETASGVMKTAPVVLIDVHTAEGLVGSSYVRCYTPTALAALARLLHDIEGLLIGQSGAPASVERRLQRHFRLLGAQGLTGIAMAGIDMALWDALAKAADMPLVTLLGGEPKAVPAYASLRTMSPRGAAEEAEELVSLGFGAIKVKIGRSEIGADLEVLRALRAAVGDDIRLMVDYNQSLTVAEAIARGRVLDNENVYWIEEPTRADDFAGHAKIATEVATPIQLGENWWGPHDAAKSIAADASDYVMLDVMKLGGVTGWLRAAALAEAHGLPVSSHTFPEFSSHLLAVSPTCHLLEYLDHVGPILKRPVHQRDGNIVISEQSGAGIEWDEDIIRRIS